MGTTLRDDRLRHRRRRRERRGGQGGADRRTVGRLPARGAVRPAGGLRGPRRGRLDDGLGRHGRHGRAQPAWSTWPATSWSSSRTSRAASACRAASGVDRMLEIVTDISEGRGTPGAVGHARGPGLDRVGRLAVRAGQDGAQPRALHAPVLPGRVRGSHQRGPLPGRCVWRTHTVRDRSRHVHAVRLVRGRVPFGSDRRGRGVLHRPGSVHPVRVVRRGVSQRSDIQELGEHPCERW